MTGAATDGATAEQDESGLRDFRLRLEERAILAYSTDGVTFAYQRPVAKGLPVGSYVQLHVPGGPVYLGQVVEQVVTLQEGPQVALDLAEGLDLQGMGRISQVSTPIRLRLVRGSGVVLGRMEAEELVPTGYADVFDAADIVLAGREPIARYLRAGARGAALLPVGRFTYADDPIEVPLRAGGFNRHTFLCGQSGSGKTFALGVIVEQLLASTDLRMVILDPNSDFVSLATLRGSERTNATRRTPLAADEYERVARRYQRRASALRVLRALRDDAQASDRLRLRFSDLAPDEQAAVLQLDPIGAREEFATLYQLVERLGGGAGGARYSLAQVEEMVLADLSADGRRLGLRMVNLGVGRWEIWSDDLDAASLPDVVTGDGSAVVDLGTLASPDEQAAAAVSVLGALWRSRHQRRPVLVVIDEAHNVCPQEPASRLQALATDYAVRIAGEGRKYGLYLLLASQRPAKIHANVLSQCDNLVLMRMNAKPDLAHLAGVFSQIPTSLLEQSSRFGLGESLVAGKLLANPTFVTFHGRLSEEGGSDVPTTWAASRD